jgi:hypothetical protein
MRYLAMGSALCAAALSAVTAIGAQPTILVGDHSLQPEQAGQTIILNVSGGDFVAGLNFNAQVADGGSEAGGTINGPKITGVDLLTGTPFAGNNTGQTEGGGVPQVAIYTVTTQNGTVSADGKLATLTLDTTGIAPGVYSLSLFETLNGPTSFLSGTGDTIDAAITDGSITIVPEPTIMALGGTMAICLLNRRRRS